MNTIYILNGPPRTAKSTIMNELAARTHVPLIATDAVEYGLRSVLVGEPHQLLRHIEFSGTAEYKSSFTEVGGTKPFSNAGTESELLLQALVGMINYYRRHKQSVAFEGTECSPSWVAGLDVPDFEVRAAYTGYTDAAHANAILSHAKDTEHDWINEWLQQDGGDETNIRNWAHEQSEKCKQLKVEAEALGFAFFDISIMPFEDYKTSVLDYFLQP